MKIEGNSYGYWNFVRLCLCIFAICWLVLPYWNIVMWYTPYEVSVWKRVWKYLLRVVLLLWIIVSFVFWYFYLLATWSQEEKKWGTFVEWIFDEVSYLPYLKSDDQSVFYQKFLFKSCLDLYNLNITTTEEWWKYAEGLCKVYTEDDQTYTVKLLDDTVVWSDWVGLNIEDIFFTYDSILRQNFWWLQWLNVWNSVNVALEDGKVKVTFPSASSDNINFFTNAILPKHIVGWMDLDTYKSSFSLNPVTDGCAKIMTQTKDINSLIFDVNDCEDTKFAYYQVKNYNSFEEFESFLRWKNKKAMVDVYSSIYWLEWFTWQNVLTSKLLWVFFNTDSWKANVRLRRSLWWLIYHNFFTWNYSDYISEYDWEFLNYYLSAWENSAELLNRLTLSDSDEAINTSDLKDSWAQELPTSMSINWVDRKFVFFVQKPEDSKNLEIKFSNEFSDIKVKSSSDWSTWSPKGYNAKDKKIVYKLINGKNLKVWVNNFTISWFIKNKTYTIASIDIYVFENLTNTESEDNQWKLSVLYYNDPASVFAIQQMRNVFKDAWVLENFVFEPVYDVEELEWKLLMWTYDMYVWTIDLWSRKDMLSLFSTEDPLLNPSRYRNPILTSLINQYYKTRDTNVQSQINILLAQDMPVIFIWNTYEPIQLQEEIKDVVFPNVDDSMEKQKVYAYRWRYDIYSKYSIVHAVRLDWEKAFNTENFETFLVSSLFPNNEVDLSDLDINLDMLVWAWKKDSWSKIPYYVFDYVSLLNM